MTIVIVLVSGVYFAGIYLLVRSLCRQPEWFEDSEGQLHFVPVERR